MSTAVAKVLAGFVAGFLATLIFHQGAIQLMHLTGLAPNPWYNMRATQPFGVPQVFSLAFWGGVWGILFALVEDRLGRGGRYWLGAAVFGAVLPTLAIWTIVQPLRGAGFFANVTMPGVLRVLAINAAWGLGTALLYGWLLPRLRGRATA